MGDIADQVIEGLICQLCLCPTDDNPGIDSPYTCGECADDFYVPHKTKAVKVKCPCCKKKVKEVGLNDHIRDVHERIKS